MSVVPAPRAETSPVSPTVEAPMPVQLPVCRAIARAVSDSVVAGNLFSRHLTPARDAANGGEQRLVGGEFISPLSIVPHQAARDWMPRVMPVETEKRPLPATC